MRTSPLLAGTAALAATAGTVALVPRATGTSWHAVAGLVGGLDPGRVLLLAAVWGAGLLAYSLVLTASLPGLSTRQALALNLGGSAVANAVPAGGPLSMGLTTAMARSWGFAPARLAGFLTVSNVWTALGRVAVGGAGLAAWSLAGPGGAPAAGGGLFAPVALVAVLGVLVAGAQRRTAAAGRVVGRVAGRALHRPDLAGRFAAGAVEARRLALDTSRRSWPRLVAGLTGYSVLLVVLLDGCLRALGHPAPLVVVLAAVGVERVAAAVPLTPGGAGVADLGVAAVLAAAGLGPAAAAGALLYRLFTFALEIPVGAAVALGWLALRGRRPAAGPPAVAAPAGDVPARAAA
ncbi:lysylphosphatidylglycerol synthase domain-containing protein [Kineosporia sp. R_H_3]|uniref:lysylphosphatidylglycerol synthase domain-containing protein n=1 Tax=Kineosporia sp. R_H_3 TaxID=1961848 RepID=UPI001304108F|nr:lysylphosphatidylglycerol synthase domain-containing protein [Kineosporia sp. R_H_3]